MLTNSVNTFTQTPSITPLKVIRSTGWIALTALTLPIFIVSRKPFDFFKEKTVEVWTQNINFSRSCEIILEEWVAEAPRGENRALVQEEIQCFLKYTYQTDLRLNNLHLTSLPDIFNDLRFSRLKNLNLGYNKLAILPESFGSLQALRILHLSANKLRALPESFGSLQALRVLNLNVNELTALPEFFGNLQVLTHLRLQENQLRALPESFGGLQALSVLNLNANELRALPESFGGLQALSILNLNCNKLATLPESFGGLQALSFLNLNCNKLATLPESFGGLQALSFLNLNCNKLATLPESFGNLQALISVDLSCNKLRTLPESFGNLQALISVDLSCNKLRTLPESFGNLQALTSLGLAYNPTLHEFPMGILQLSSNCDITLQDSGISMNTLERLRTHMSSSDYSGPNISFFINNRDLGREKSLEESLKCLYGIIGEIPRQFAKLEETLELRLWLHRLSGTADYQLGGASKKHLLQKY